MFGYLTPEKGELKVKEYEVYRAHYCGVCFALKKRCSLISCASLTYDSAFLSVLGASMQPLEPASLFRCPFKPYRRVNVAKGECTDYAADANAILAKKKCEDDRIDGNPLRGTLGSLALNRAFRKASKRLSALLPGIDGGMNRLAALEAEGCDRIDEPALAFAQVTESLFSGMPAPKTAKEPLSWMGRNLGRWLYLIDAWDDLDKDEKKGNYNVLINQFGSAKAAKEQKERIAFNLLHSLYEASTALPFLPAGPLSPIVDNTVREGAAQRSRKLLAKYDKAPCSTDGIHDTIAEINDSACHLADTQEEI